MTTEDLYADYRGVGDNLKKTLTAMADRAQELEQEIAKAEAELLTLQNQYTDVVQKQIPEAMDGMGGKLNLDDGRVIEVKEHIAASVAGEKKYPAIDWLDDHNYGALVKRRVIFEFNRLDQEQYQDFMAHVLPVVKSKGLVMREDHQIHPQTLMAWVRDKIKEGVPLPADIFSIIRINKATIKE